MPDVTLLDLVKNNTMSEHIAALLWTIAEEKQWFVTAAVPRKAGKSTVLSAALQFVPPGTPIHRLTGQIEEIRQLGKAPDGGYLEVGEISTEPPVRYIWGEPVRALFDTLNAGFSLATTMHAADVHGVFEQICHGNGISDEQASRIRYVICIERHGDDEPSYWRRMTAAYEVSGVKAGNPTALLLHRWVEADDRFEQVDSPRLLRASAAALEERARLIRGLVDAGRTSVDDIAALVPARK